jgi:L-alanine-DL-glutamate epimerase-like enolase superfamily enzyme
VLAGNITWNDYRHADNPHVGNIRHRRTGVVVPLSLEDEDGEPFYPALDTYLAELPRLGLPIVLTSGERGPAHPYSMVYAQRRVREARERVGPDSHITLDACRHGGLTEAADAGATDQGMRAL